MPSWSAKRVYHLLMVVSLIALLAAPAGGAAWARPGTPESFATAMLPVGADATVVEPALTSAGAPTGLESRLAHMLAAQQAGDSETLASFAGERHFDLAAGVVRVILEMSRSPEAHAVGAATYEIVALPNGKQATIEHAPQIAVRAELEAAIAAAGATYETAYENWVQVSAPLGSLEALSRIADVAYVRFPFPAQQHDVPARAAAAPDAPQVGAQTSEGVVLTNADHWQGGGYNGSGVNLAVYDFGFTGWAARQTAGDLPAGANLVLKDYSAAYSFNPDTANKEHGTACAEAAYDMAPGTKVYLYAWGTDAEFASAVADYRTNAAITGKKVATMSIGWVNAGPYDGTGSIATIVDAAQTDGIFWANSAGNSRKAHYSWTSAQYGTGNSVAFGTGNLNAFGTDPTTGTVWVIPSGTTLSLYLEWNDWNAGRTGNANHVDYNLGLFKWTGSDWSLVASSTSNQCTGAAAPVEAIQYTTSGTTNPYYAAYVERYTTGCTNNFGHWMELYTFNGFYASGVGEEKAFWYINECNSLTIPADASSVVATGATFWNEDGSSTYDYGLESFSSFGPRNASGGANPGTTVNKPDVVAPDGVSTATYGASNAQAYRVNTSTGFFGTSAAAPHVAGLAADVWSHWPGYTLAQVRNYVQTEALYKGTGGTCGGSLMAAPAGDPSPQSGTQNNRYGWGRIVLPVSPTAIALGSFAGQALPVALPLAGAGLAGLAGLAAWARRRAR